MLVQWPRFLQAKHRPMKQIQRKDSYLFGA